MTGSSRPIHRSGLPALFMMFGLALSCQNLAFATDLPVYGGLGGNNFRAQCPQGSYLVGLAGRTGSWVDRIAPVCAPWLRGSQTLGAPLIGQSFGASDGGQERQTVCIGSGHHTHAIQSWWIHLLRSDNHYVQFIQVYCTSFASPVSATSGWRLDFGSYPANVEEMVTGGPFISKPPFQACPASEVAVGIRVRAGQFVDAIGLICGPMPAKLGAPVTKLPGPVVQAPTPAVPLSPQAKNMRIPDDMFVITKPAAGERVPQGQLVITATPPKVGDTNVTELELRYLDAPLAQRDSYPYVTVFSVGTENLKQGYPVAPIVTGAYSGRWHVRARSSMKTVPGPWSNPVQFQLVKAQPPPPMVQLPKPNAPITQTPAPGSSMMQAPAPSSAASQMRRSPSMILPRGVDEKGGTDSNQTVDQPTEPEKKP